MKNVLKILVALALTVLGVWIGTMIMGNGGKPIQTSFPDAGVSCVMAENEKGDMSASVGYVLDGYSPVGTRNSRYGVQVMSRDSVRFADVKWNYCTVIIENNVVTSVAFTKYILSHHEREYDIMKDGISKRYGRGEEEGESIYWDADGGDVSLYRGRDVVDEIPFTVIRVVYRYCIGEEMDEKEVSNEF